MSKDISINEFYSSFCEEIALAQDVETYGWEPQDFFTAVMLGYLEDAGEIEDPIICPFRGYGLQLNAYHISESYDEVDIFVSVYKESPVLSSVSRTDIDAAVKEVFNCIEGLPVICIQLLRKTAIHMSLQSHCTTKRLKLKSKSYCLNKRNS